MAFSDLSISPQSLSLTTAKCTWVYKYPRHLQQICVEHLGCVSLGESKNGFVIPEHVDSSTPKKRKIQNRIILS